MIGNISFSGIIKPQINNFNKPALYSADIKSDTFERTENPLSQIISHAKNKIMEVLKENNTEYGFTISKDGRILEESNGDAHSCSTDARKIEPDSILIHGHPVPTPLSSGDVAVLLATDSKTMEAVTVDGKYSRLTKKYPSKEDSLYIELYPALEKQLRMKVLDALGIDYNINKHDLIEMFKDYLGNEQSYPLSDEYAVNESIHFGINFQDDNLEDIQSKLKDLMSFHLLINPYKYDKIHNLVIKYYDEINNYLNSPAGTEVRHKFLEDVASQYDLIYETNLFDE